jgi:sterol desaturase/sphingolipid hydroxylase (fatty acid hydroxylase superfamily)
MLHRMALLDFSAVLQALLIGALLFFPLEWLLPLPGSERRSARGWITDLAHATFGAQAIKTGAAVLLAVLLMGRPESTLAARLPIWTQVIALLLVCDFIIYVLHRALHGVPLLWRFHRIHHSSVRMDWLAAARVHPLEQILLTTATGLPMFLLGFSPEALAIYVGIYQVHSLLLHAHTRLSFGPLAAVFTPPWVHHWHHADQPEAYDSNFGSQLVIWDKLFGTAYRPAERRPERFGVDTAPEENFVTHLLAPFKAQPAG